MTVDIHSHVLPGIDDGSQSVQESLAMLRQLRSQGADLVAATPHFYPEENTPEKFLEKRAGAYKRLKAGMDKAVGGLPELRLGAEVYYFGGVAQAEDIHRLRLEGTDLLLLEMPFGPWSQRMLQEIFELNARPDIQVLLAHIERYMRWQSPRVWDELRENGVLFQCNASFFLHWKTKWKGNHMLESGRMHFLGTDSHNMDSRPPNLDKALGAISKSGLRALEKNIETYAPGLRSAGK